MREGGSCPAVCGAAYPHLFDVAFAALSCSCVGSLGKSPGHERQRAALADAHSARAALRQAPDSERTRPFEVRKADGSISLVLLLCTQAAWLTRPCAASHGVQQCFPSAQAGGLADAAFSSEDGASEAGTSQSGTVRGEERENGGAAPAPWSAAGAGVAAVSGRCAHPLQPVRAPGHTGAPAPTLHGAFDWPAEKDGIPDPLAPVPVLCEGSRTRMCAWQTRPGAWLSRPDVCTSVGRHSTQLCHTRLWHAAPTVAITRGAPCVMRECCASVVDAAQGAHRGGLGAAGAGAHGADGGGRGRAAGAQKGGRPAPAALLGPVYVCTFV